MTLDRMLRDEIDDEDFRKLDEGIDHCETQRYDEGIRVLTDLITDLPPGTGVTMEGTARQYLAFAYLAKKDDVRGMRELEAAYECYRQGPVESLRNFEIDVDMFLQEYY